MEGGDAESARARAGGSPGPPLFVRLPREVPPSKADIVARQLGLRDVALRTLDLEVMGDAAHEVGEATLQTSQGTAAVKFVVVRTNMQEVSMQSVMSAWILIAAGIVLILLSALAGPAYGWVSVLGLAVGGLLVVAGLRRRRRLAAPPGV